MGFRLLLNKRSNLIMSHCALGNCENFVKTQLCNNYKNNGQMNQ